MRQAPCPARALTNMIASACASTPAHERQRPVPALVIARGLQLAAQQLRKVGRHQRLAGVHAARGRAPQAPARVTYCFQGLGFQLVAARPSSSRRSSSAELAASSAWLASMQRGQAPPRHLQGFAPTLGLCHSAVPSARATAGPCVRRHIPQAAPKQWVTSTTHRGHCCRSVAGNAPAHTARMHLK